MSYYLAMPGLSQNPLLILFGLAFVILLLLYLREYNRRKKLQTEGDKFLQTIKEKGWETLNASIKKSQDLLGQAELEGIKVVAESKLGTSQIEKDYSQQLSSMLRQSAAILNSSQAQLTAFLEDLKKQGQQFETATQSATQQRINQLFESLEERLSNFLISTEQKTTSSIELELKAARQLIETYRTQQLKMIDENIIAMMEQTLNIVLAKKLSLKDQLDLVYQALDRAKAEKFIA